MDDERYERAKNMAAEQAVATFLSCLEYPEYAAGYDPERVGRSIGNRIEAVLRERCWGGNETPWDHERNAAWHALDRCFPRDGTFVFVPDED
jgi:hypothetical protein